MTAQDARACRITKVTTYLVGARWRNFVFAHVETDEGISGSGQGALDEEPQAGARPARELTPRYAIGRSAFATEKLWHDIVRKEFMHSPIINSAAAALEMAMLDIAGKALGRPLYDLLGGKVHEVLPAYANAWYGVGKTAAEIGAAAKAAAAKGYRGLKFDPFEDAGRDPERASIRRAVEIVEAVRAAVGPNVDLMIDAHGLFSPGSAIATARELEPYDLFWFEEPCDPENAAS